MTNLSLPFFEHSSAIDYGERTIYILNPSKTENLILLKVYFYKVSFSNRSLIQQSVNYNTLLTECRVHLKLMKKIIRGTTICLTAMKISVLLILMSSSTFCFAQTDSVTVEELVELSFADLIDAPVSSASKIGQKASATPSIISVINRDQLIKYQWTSLNDIAFKQAGFCPAQDRFNQIISSRGISDQFWSKRLLILFDGVPFSSFQSSVTDQAFSINMAKSVEIVRGPGAALYGSQAVTGVVQVNSLSYSDLRGNGEVEVKVGDYGYRNLNVLTGTKGKKVNTLISFNSYSSEGNEYESYDVLLKRDANGNFIKQRTQDEKNSQHFWTKMEGKDKLSGLTFCYSLQNYNFQMGHGFISYFPENEKTSSVTRNLLKVRYMTPRSSKKWTQEYVLKYDHEISRYNMQLVPVGFQRTLSNGQQDSSGVYEEYITPVQNLFARSQWVYLFDNQSTILFGAEQNTVFYNGDKLHNSNVNLSAPGFLPFNTGKLEPIGPLYEPIKDHPVNTSAIYTQLTSGNMLGNKLTATIGARYDMYYYTYKDFATKLNKKRFATHFSPRVALVYQANEKISWKALYGNGFRFASPFEQFIANSIISGAGRGNIKPEDITSFELSSDWTIRKRTKWRNTLFYSIFKDQIRNNTRINAFDNVANTTQTGFESEINFSFANFSAFTNFSLVKRIKASSIDPFVPSSDSLIGYPENAVNAGLTYNYKKWMVTAQGHYQSLVDRRKNEKGAPATGINAGINYDELRGRKVKPWFTADMNINYLINESLEARIIVNNVFDKEYYLINTLSGREPQPFDYRQAGRRIMVALKLNF